MWMGTMIWHFDSSSA